MEFIIKLGSNATNKYIQIQNYKCFLAFGTGKVLFRNIFQIIFVGFWRCCISIKRTMFLDFSHRLVSQEQTKLKKIKKLKI